MITLNILIKHIKDIIENYPDALEIVNDQKELSIRFDYKLNDDWSKFLNKDYVFWITDIDITNNKNYMNNLKMLLKAKKFLREIKVNN